MYEIEGADGCREHVMYAGKRQRLSLVCGEAEWIKRGAGTLIFIYLFGQREEPMSRKWTQQWETDIIVFGCLYWTLCQKSSINWKGVERERRVGVEKSGEEKERNKDVRVGKKQKALHCRDQLLESELWYLLHQVPCCLIEPWQLEEDADYYTHWKKKKERRRGPSENQKMLKKRG